MTADGRRSTGRVGSHRVHARRTQASPVGRGRGPEPRLATGYDDPEIHRPITDLGMVKACRRPDGAVRVDVS